MKIFEILMLAAIAVGQEFQQNYNPSVLVAETGHFQQREGSGSKSSNQQRPRSQLQSNFDQQNLGSQFQQNVNDHSQGFGNFHSNTGSSLQSSFNQQSSGDRINPNHKQSNIGNGIRSNNNINNQVSHGSQFQPSSSLASTSGSSSDSSKEFPSGVFEPLNLPSGAGILLGEISTSFSCSGRPYGYYADQENSCRVFHVCFPTLFDDVPGEIYQYSFFCGEGSVFDQNQMTCVVESLAIPCQESQQYLFKNEEFGLQEERSR